MTDFVIDANVLMSILISGKGSYKPILTYNNFIVPDFALIEVEKYESTLKNKTRLLPDQFTEWTYFVFSNIIILPKYILEGGIIAKSKKLLEEIDSKDVAYVALGMQLGLPLLTRDTPLYWGLKKQGFRKVILFEDFLNKL